VMVLYRTICTKAKHNIYGNLSNPCFSLQNMIGSKKLNTKINVGEANRATSIV